MIAQHFSGIQPGEHLRSLVFEGPGPEISVGKQPTDQVQIKRYPWLETITVGSYDLKTDKGTGLVLCDLTPGNPKLDEIASRLNGQTPTALQLILDGIKRLADEEVGLKNLAWLSHIFYASKNGHGGNTVRVYFTSVGTYSGRKLLGLMAACGNKPDEQKVITTMRGGGVRNMH